jgi:hypothetical protein
MMPRRDGRVPLQERNFSDINAAARQQIAPTATTPVARSAAPDGKHRSLARVNQLDESINNR